MRSNASDGSILFLGKDRKKHKALKIIGKLIKAGKIYRAGWGYISCLLIRTLAE